MGERQCTVKIGCDVLNQDRLQNRESLLSVIEGQPLLLEHCGERIAHFPGNRTRTDERIPCRQLYDSVSFRLAKNDSQQRRCVHHYIHDSSFALDNVQLYNASRGCQGRKPSGYAVGVSAVPRTRPAHDARVTAVTHLVPRSLGDS